MRIGALCDFHLEIILRSFFEMKPELCVCERIILSPDHQLHHANVSAAPVH